MKVLKLNGNDLTLEDLHEVVHAGRDVLLEPGARLAVERSRALVDELVAGNGVAYAITTGVGIWPMCGSPPIRRASCRSTWCARVCRE